MWLLVLLFTELYIKIELECTKARYGDTEYSVIFILYICAYVYVYRCKDEGNFFCAQLKGNIVKHLNHCLWLRLILLYVAKLIFACRYLQIVIFMGVCLEFSYKIELFSSNHSYFGHIS